MGQITRSWTITAWWEPWLRRALEHRQMEKLGSPPPEYAQLYPWPVVEMDDLALPEWGVIKSRNLHSPPQYVLR